MVCLATDDSYFILQVDTGAIAAALETKQGLGEDGLESAFDVSHNNIICINQKKERKKTNKQTISIAGFGRSERTS